MPNKLLKTLTIDGTANDIFYPSRQFISKSNITLAANTMVKTDPVTLNTGRYLCQVSALFKSATTTGATQRNIGIASATGTAFSVVNHFLDATNADTRKVFFCTYSVGEGNTLDLCGAISSSKASNAGCAIEMTVIKISDDPLN